MPDEQERRQEPPAFDEEFIRGAAFTEPSARERAQRPGPLARWRARRIRRDVRAPGERRLPRIGVPFRRSPRGYREPSYARSVFRLVAAVAALVAISVGLWWWQHEPRDGAPPPSAAAPEPVTPQDPTVGDPFAGSPAKSYAPGEWGIQMPDPEAMGGLSRGELGMAYGHIKKLLAAGNLDPATVFGGRTAAFAKLLDPEQRSAFERGLDRRGSRNTRSWLTSFAPGVAEQVGDVVKVDGKVTARKARDQGRTGVKVETVHNFVYAVRRPGRPDTVTRVILRRATEVFVFRDRTGVTIWLSRSDRTVTPAKCDTENEPYVHPEFDGEAAGTGPSGRPLDPYDLSQEPEPGKCSTATRI
ncbi:hypothetical protein [Actinomadura yumaensis]|uniref:Uncharacterized protein n=1 Tax=Actinomadura yumaensis TaxID=111807 RepID=A0ABW2CCG8_9ACTN